MTSEQLPGAPIDKTPLRERVYLVLRDRLLAGGFEEEARLSDGALGEALGVSRTPVREALLRLEAEGLLQSDHLRGFFVPPLDREEAREVYPILWTLEALALELDVPDLEQIRRLRDVNRRLAAAEDPMERHRIDRQFHEGLTGAAANRHLRRALHALRDRLLRYEIGFMAGGGDVRVSVEEHEALLDALENGEDAVARDRLRRHWRRSLSRFGREDL